MDAMEPVPVDGMLVDEEGRGALIRTLLPRERLFAEGAERLTDRELLAVVLGTGTKGRSVFAVCEELLPSPSGIERLEQLTFEELCGARGVGAVGASRLLAVLEIARRMGRARPPPSDPLQSPAAIHSWMRPRMIGERRESVWVLLLDIRRRWMGERLVSVGSLSTSVIHPREVFRPAVGLSASAIVLVHNHPSGDPSPSLEDHQVTARLAEAGAVLGIEFLDHVIVAAEGYRSFREEGWLVDRD